MKMKKARVMKQGIGKVESYNRILNLNIFGRKIMIYLQWFPKSERESWNISGKCND